MILNWHTLIAVESVSTILLKKKANKTLHGNGSEEKTAVLKEWVELFRN